MSVPGFCSRAHQICRDPKKVCGDCLALSRRVKLGKAKAVEHAAEVEILENGLPVDFFLSASGKRRLASEGRL